MLNNINLLKCKINSDGNSPDWPAIVSPEMRKPTAFEIANDSVLGKRRFSQTSDDDADTDSMEWNRFCVDFKLYSS